MNIHKNDAAFNDMPSSSSFTCSVAGILDANVWIFRTFLTLNTNNPTPCYWNIVTGHWTLADAHINSYQSDISKQLMVLKLISFLWFVALGHKNQIQFDWITKLKWNWGNWRHKFWSLRVSIAFKITFTPAPIVSIGISSTILFSSFFFCLFFFDLCKVICLPMHA